MKGELITELIAWIYNLILDKNKCTFVFLKYLLVKLSFKPFFICIANWGDWITFLKNLFLLRGCLTAKIAIPPSANAVSSCLLTFSSPFLVSFRLYNTKVEKSLCFFTYSVPPIAPSEQCKIFPPQERVID